jgi:hypothetical protein
MRNAPYDEAGARRATDGLDLQRISVRGVLAQDFMVDMAQRGLELLAREENPLRDPTIRSQLSGQPGYERLVPIADERVDEAIGLLREFVLDHVEGKPLRYRRIDSAPHVVTRTGAWESIRIFGGFAVDKCRVLPRWVGYVVRSSLQRRTGRTLHGEGGAELIEMTCDPFGDAAEFERDIVEANMLRAKGIETLAMPAALTSVGPDTYAGLWGAMRQGAFRLLDGGGAHDAAALEKVLSERKLDGTLPHASLVCPDARDPWSAHAEVAALVEAETRDLPLTIGWLDVDDAARWSEVLEELAVTYDERVAAVEAARRLVDEELSQVAASALDQERDLAAVDALLALDEHDHGPILNARIAAALAGVDPDVHSRLVPPPPPDVDHPISPPPPDDSGTPSDTDAPTDEEPSDEGAVDEDRSEDEPIPVEEPTEEEPQLRPTPPAFDRDAALAWRIELESRGEDLDARRETLEVQAEELQIEREVLEQVHPVVTEDLLRLRAWRWRLERSFAGRLVHVLDEERGKVEKDLAKVEEALRRERPELEPTGNLYRQFVRRMGAGILISGLLARFLWKPILRLIGLEYGEGSALIAGYLGVPAYPFIVLFLGIVLWALISYHRAWSQRRRALDAIRHELWQLPALVQHVQRERLRIFELGRQAREMLRLMSEVIHRPFLLDSIANSLPTSVSIDPLDLPKVVRIARPVTDDTWTGETRFVQRILKSQFRRGWRTDAYALLLEHVQAKHGVVKGRLDAERADRDPTVRTAVVEHLLLDEAQRGAGVARVRDVIQDILGWSVQPDFPYPQVRVIRVERDPIDVRTDMFASDEEPADDWQQFLGADVAADERWTPMSFAPDHRREHLEQRDQVVHAPSRFHGRSDASTFEPRPDEVRPVELVVRLDLLPEAVPTARLGAFHEGPLGDEQRRTRRDDVEGATSEYVAAEADDGAVDDVRYNF